MAGGDLQGVSEAERMTHRIAQESARASDALAACQPQAEIWAIEGFRGKLQKFGRLPIAGALQQVGGVGRAEAELVKQPSRIAAQLPHQVREELENGRVDSLDAVGR